jgi:hypothetical protein
VETLSRRSLALFAVACLALAGGLAAGLALAFGRSDSHALTRGEYLRQLTSICRRYGKQLDQVRPPADIATPGEVAESVGKALPILKRQAAEIRRLKPPPALRPNLDRFFALTDRSTAGLELALKGALARDIGQMGRGELQFVTARDQAQRIALSLGFRCH